MSTEPLLNTREELTQETYVQLVTQKRFKEAGRRMQGSWQKKSKAEKVDKVKQQAMAKKIEDKTFGMKNKNK